MPLLHQDPAALPPVPGTTGPLVFVAMQPCRVVDTRAAYMFLAPFGPPSLLPGPPRAFPLQSSTKCSIPATAQAYSLNVTVIPPGFLGNVVVWATGQPQPDTVTIDDVTGDVRNNAAIVEAGTPNGSISVAVSQATDLVIDINGYYMPVYGRGGSHSTDQRSGTGDCGTDRGHRANRRNRHDG